MKSKHLDKWLLVVLPLLYLVLSGVYLSSIKDFSIYNFDPSYVYLFNGINLASGHIRVGIVEHPGTPVEIFTGIVILVKHFITGDGILYEDVLLHPESYLFTCSIVLAIMLSLITYLTGKYVFKHTANIAVALLFQCSPLLFGDTIRMSISLSAESCLTICGIFFIAYLYVNTMVKQTPTNRNILLFGLFTALLITTKIYSLPIILLILFLIKKRKQWFLFLFSIGFFSTLLLFPLYNQLRNWLGWIKSMLLHTSAYGQGQAGIVDTTLYKDSLIDILTKHYLFDFVFLFVLVAFISVLLQKLKKNQTPEPYFLPITGIFIYFLAYMLVIAKQYIYKYPSPLLHQTTIITKFYYFIPLFICFPLAIIVSYKIMPGAGTKGFFYFHKVKTFYVLFAILIALGGKQAYSACCNRQYQNLLSDKTRPFLNKLKNTPLIIVTDGSKDGKEQAYSLGVAYAGKWDAPRYLDFISTIYPSSYLYTTFDNSLSSWTKKVDISTILKKNNQALIYINGTDSLAEATILSRICDGQLQKNGGNLTKIYSTPNKYEEIYLLKADTLH